jgi:hypothetical protein
VNSFKLAVTARFPFMVTEQVVPDGLSQPVQPSLTDVPELNVAQQLPQRCPRRSWLSSHCRRRTGRGMDGRTPDEGFDELPPKARRRVTGPPRFGCAVLGPAATEGVRRRVCADLARRQRVG